MDTYNLEIQIRGILLRYRLEYGHLDIPDRKTGDEGLLRNYTRDIINLFKEFNNENRD